jgi:hypothetical protein
LIKNTPCSSQGVSADCWWHRRPSRRESRLHPVRGPPPSANATCLASAAPSSPLYFFSSFYRFFSSLASISRLHFHLGSASLVSCGRRASAPSAARLAGTPSVSTPTNPSQRGHPLDHHPSRSAALVRDWSASAGSLLGLSPSRARSRGFQPCERHTLRLHRHSPSASQTFFPRFVRSFPPAPRLFPLHAWPAVPQGSLLPPRLSRPSGSQARHNLLQPSLPLSTLHSPQQAFPPPSTPHSPPSSSRSPCLFSIAVRSCPLTSPYPPARLARLRHWPRAICSLFPNPATNKSLPAASASALYFYLLIPHSSNSRVRETLFVTHPPRV